MAAEGIESLEEIRGCAFVNHAERIIVALDLDSKEAIENILVRLPDVRFVKVGMELFYSNVSPIY